MDRKITPALKEMLLAIVKHNQYNPKDTFEDFFGR